MDCEFESRSPSQRESSADGRFFHAPPGANPGWTTAKGGNHDDPQAGEMGAIMADENGTQQADPTPRTFTQEEVNELMGKVRREVSGKYADYDDLKKKAIVYDEAQEATKSELEKARDVAAKAKAEADALKAEKARAEIAAKVSAATGVPASLISGDDEEAMTASAQAIAEYAKSASTVAPTDKGGAARHAKASTSDLFADALSQFSK